MSSTLCRRFADIHFPSAVRAARPDVLRAASGCASPTATARPRTAPEEPKPARPPLLTLPSPEQLGVAVRPVETATDWTAMHARMKELGVLSFHMDSLPDGRARFTCWLPRDRPGLTRRIEALAASETEAVQLALQQADHMRRGRP